MTGIDIRGLSKRYGKVNAVDSIDLHMGAGEFLTLLGPSGSGKTTTLRMVAGLEVPDAGTIQVGERIVSGANVNVPPHRRNMGMVFQSYAVWPHKTVYDNVAFPLKMRRIHGKDERARVERMLDLVGMPCSEYGSRYPSELSGGQQQRVALARALVANPEVILYDEPLSNLDAKLRDSMRVLLRSIHDELGVTSLYVTHDQIEAMVLSDRICVMNCGRIVQQGSPRELYEQPQDLFVADFIGQANVLALDAPGGDGELFAIGGGLAVRVPKANLRAAGSARSLVIRPHRVQMLTADEAHTHENVFKGIVQEVIFLGDRFRYSIELAPRCTVIAEVVAASGLPERGNAVHVALPGTSCIVI
jgi:ABC-type Fe3+/spermidine/putrescine transport system ATPase subunit